MLTVDAEQTARALAFDTLTPALRARGAHTPDRHHHVIDAGTDATLLLMPSWTDGDSSSAAGRRTAATTARPSGSPAPHPHVGDTPGPPSAPPSRNTPQ
jgi:hypothetical protein